MSIADWQGVVISWVQVPLFLFTADPVLCFQVLYLFLERWKSTVSPCPTGPIQRYRYKEKSNRTPVRDRRLQLFAGWFTVQQTRRGFSLGDKQIVFPSLLWAQGFGETLTCSTIDPADCFLSRPVITGLLQACWWAQWFQVLSWKEHLCSTPWESQNTI